MSRFGVGRIACGGVPDLEVHRRLACLKPVACQPGETRRSDPRTQSPRGCQCLRADGIAAREVSRRRQAPRSGRGDSPWLRAAKAELPGCQPAGRGTRRSEARTRLRLANPLARSVDPDDGLPGPGSSGLRSATGRLVCRQGTPRRPGASGTSRCRHRAGDPGAPTPRCASRGEGCPDCPGRRVWIDDRSGRSVTRPACLGYLRTRARL